MQTILFPDPPDRRPLPPVSCASWCSHSDGHVDAVHESERVCTSYPHRIEAAQGGGTSDDYGITSPGSLVMQVERQQGQPATIVVGIQLMDREYYVRLSLPEFAVALLYGQIAHAQAQSA